MNSGCWRGRVLGLAAALIVFTGICAGPAAAAPGRAECRTAPSKILGHPVPYCVILPSDYDTDKASTYPVLYFLHGLGGNEQMLLNSGGMNMIQDLRESKRIGEFLIVAPDGGAASTSIRATARCATRIFSYASFCRTSRATTGFARKRNRAGLPAFRWGDMARCGLRCDIRICLWRLARTALL